MPANTTDVRQHVLTRSDLTAMSVADERVDAWLAGGELALVDMIEEPTGSTAIYAATTDSLRDQLLLLLEQHGRTDVRLGADEVRTIMVQHTENAEAEKQEDVLAEHVAADELDRAIDDITHAIDDLVESSDKFPQELKDVTETEGAVAIAHEGDTEEIEALDDADETAAEAPAAVAAATAPMPSDVPVGTAESIPPEENEEPAAEAAHAVPNPAPTPLPVPAAPTPEPIAIDLTPVVDSLQQLNSTLQQVHLAVLALGERPVPQFDASPITGALDHGFRALQQDVAAAGDRSALREGIELLRSTIESSNRSVVEAVEKAAATDPRSVAPTTLVADAPSTSRGLDVAAAIATVAIATGWGVAIWTFAGDARLALGAVVCANLVGCCALMLRRK